MLLYRRRRNMLLQLLNIGSHMNGVYLMELQVLGMAPKEKLADVRVVRTPGIGVADLSREELDETVSGTFTGSTDHDRQLGIAEGDDGRILGCADQ